MAARILSVGWTIDDWRRSAALGLGHLDRLLTLRDELSPDDPAWTARCSADDIRSQWERLARFDESHELPLRGVPFAVKDNIDVAIMTTTAGCPAFGYLASEDAAVVQRLRDAGAIVVGKTNLDQFATGLVGTRSPFGIVKNPFDERFIAGGSSSGSGVVVGKGWYLFGLLRQICG